MTFLKIVFAEGTRRFYCPGEIIRGTVELHLDKVRKIQGLNLTIRGKAKAHWSTGASNSRKHHHGKEVYIDQKMYLLGDLRAPAVEMTIGIHRYNFEFQLPFATPASIEGSRGSIRYYVQANLDVPWSFDKECKVEVKVARKDDCSGFLENVVPQTVETEIDTNTLFKASKPLNVKATIPYKVFTPGALIPITIHLDNQGRFNLEKIQIRLKQYFDFHSYRVGKDRFSSMQDMNTLIRSHFDGTPKFSSKTFVVHFKLPDVLNTTNVAFSRVVQISYCLQILVLGEKLKFPIIISNVPITLNNVQSQIPQPMPSSSIPTFSMPEPYHLVVGSVESPPPTFDEASKMPDFKNL